MLAPTAALAARLQRVREALGAHDLSALLVTHAPNVAYLTNLRASAGALVVTRDEATLIIDFRYMTAARALLDSPSAPPDTRLLQVEGTYDETIVKRLRSISGRIGIEAAHLPVKRFAHFGAALADAGEPPPSLVPVDDLVEGLRKVKDEHEIARLREAARMLSSVARTIVREVPAIGRSELEMAADIDFRLRQAGFEKPAFDTIVAGGPNGALPHAHPGERVLGAGELLVLDFGGVHGGYCVDLTRTVWLGEPGPERRRMHQAVAEAQQAAIAAVRAGVWAREVDAAARDALGRYGLAEAFGHSTGHGLGLEVHEAPRLAPRPAEADERLEAGMVVTIEPGVYLPDLGGVRIEDDVLVTADGCEVLTDVPRG